MLRTRKNKPSYQTIIEEALQVYSNSITKVLENQIEELRPDGSELERAGE